MTFAQLEADVRLVYNGIDQDDLLKFLNETQDEITARVQLYPETTEDVTWTAQNITDGVASWAVSGNVQRIWEAHYRTSATEYTTLTRTNKHKLDADFPGWRLAQSGTPSWWYEDGGYIGLYQKPNTAPTAGYPKVTLYTHERTALTTGSSFPAQVDTADAWLYGVLYRYARHRDPARKDEFHKDYMIARKRLIDHIKAINARDYAQARVNVPSIRNL